MQWSVEICCCCCDFISLPSLGYHLRCILLFILSSGFFVRVNFIIIIVVVVVFYGICFFWEIYDERYLTKLKIKPEEDSFKGNRVRTFSHSGGIFLCFFCQHWTVCVCVCDVFFSFLLPCEKKTKNCFVKNSVETCSAV